MGKRYSPGVGDHRYAGVMRGVRLPDPYTAGDFAAKPRRPFFDHGIGSLVERRKDDLSVVSYSTSSARAIVRTACGPSSFTSSGHQRCDAVFFKPPPPV